MFKLGQLIQTALTPFQPTPKPVAPAAATEAPPAKADVRDVLALSKTVAPAAAPATLSEEERTLQAARLLPENYAELKGVMLTQGVAAAQELYRQGKRGPFSSDFGNPLEMLKSAQRIHANPELSRMAQDVRKGDILIETWNKPDDAITKFTNGPFIHARICVSDEAPPQFIEAVGITGQAGDPTTNRVRYTTLPDSPGQTLRIVRPAEGMPEPEQSRAIDRAVHYAEAQLGKGYDYAFTDVNKGTGVTDAYYCSELTYLAYASPQGAGINVPIHKSSDRDEVVVALNAVVDALQPENKAELMDQAMKLVKRNPKPTSGDMVAFLVDNVMTKCRATEKVTQSQADRDRLKQTIETLMAGQGFPNLHGSLDKLHAEETKGDFDTPILGWARQQQARGAVALGFSEDMAHLLGTSGLNYSETAATTWHVLGAILPHSEVLASFLFGPKDGRTQAVGKVLDSLDWVKQHAPSLPGVGDFGIHNLPARAKPETKADFVSPTDLAWGDFAHADYNVKPGHPVDEAGYEGAQAGG